MQRYDVINKLIEKHGYKNYLEIGTQNDFCLREIKCEYKVGVDPEPNFHEEENSDEFYEMTSDEFFKQNKDTFDIIFIDGLHENKQVRRDIRNALKCISKDGAIVVHDCSPLDELSQQYPMPHVPSWNGNVWKAWLKFRTYKNLKMFVVDCDQGCGVIMDGEQEPLKECDITFDEFCEKREYYLNLISEDGFAEILSM